MQQSNKEKRTKKILLIGGIAIVACIVLLLGLSHHRGSSPNTNRWHLFSWNQEEQISVGEESLLSPTAKDQQIKNLTYLGMEGLRAELGEEHYQMFKKEFESYLSGSGAPVCTTVALAAPAITADEEHTACYLQTDDDHNSLYQFIYRNADDSYSFIAVDALPEELTELPAPVQSTGQQDGSDKQNSQESSEQGGAASTSTEPANTSNESGNTADNQGLAKPAGSTDSATGNSTQAGKYHTVNGVQFENDALYDLLSEKAVDLFTKDLTKHWSETGEDRTLIRTTTPVKNGSKVTYTCTFPDGGDSFQVTLDLNQETFSYQ